MTLRGSIGPGGAMTSFAPGGSGGGAVSLRLGSARHRAARPWVGRGTRARRYEGVGRRAGTAQPGTARNDTARGWDGRALVLLLSEGGTGRGGTGVGAELGPLRSEGRWETPGRAVPVSSCG